MEYRRAADLLRHEKGGGAIADERAGAHQVRQNYYYHEAARLPAGGQVADGETLCRWPARRRPVLSGQGSA